MRLFSAAVAIFSALFVVVEGEPAREAPFACTRQWAQDQGNDQNCNSNAATCQILNGCGPDIDSGYYPDLTRADAYCFCDDNGEPANHQICPTGTVWDGFPNNYGTYLSGADSEGTPLGRNGFWGTIGGNCVHDYSVSQETQQRPPYNTSPTSSPGHPTGSPTLSPTGPPTLTPTGSPTLAPIYVQTPTVSPTKAPTNTPTNAPTKAPSKSPTKSPTYNGVCRAKRGGKAGSTNDRNCAKCSPNRRQKWWPCNVYPRTICEGNCVFWQNGRRVTPTAPPAPVAPTPPPTLSPLPNGCKRIPRSDPRFPQGHGQTTDNACGQCVNGYQGRPNGYPWYPCNKTPRICFGTGCSWSTPNPTASPTANPTVSPTANPTSNPTVNPTASPTASPTANPTSNPTANPTVSPTASPTASPTDNPTSNPTANPTASPTANPTSNPTASPTASPTFNPTSNPTANPTASPTVSPTASPTTSPSESPTQSPTRRLGFNTVVTGEPAIDPFNEVARCSNRVQHGIQFNDDDGNCAGRVCLAKNPLHNVGCDRLILDPVDINAIPIQVGFRGRVPSAPWTPNYDECCDSNSCVAAYIETDVVNVPPSGGNLNYNFGAQTKPGGISVGDWYEVLVGLYKLNGANGQYELVSNGCAHYRGDRVLQSPGAFSIASGGVYKLRFFAGSYDETNGTVLGAELQVFTFGYSLN